MPGQIPTPQPMTGMSTQNRILEKLTVSQPVEMFLELYGTRIFTRFHHWFPRCVRLFQSASLHPASLISTLILSAGLFLCLPNDLYLQGFSIINLYAFKFSPMRAISPTQSIFLRLVLIILSSEDCRLSGVTLLLDSCYFLHLRCNHTLQHPVSVAVNAKLLNYLGKWNGVQV